MKLKGETVLLLGAAAVALYFGSRFFDRATDKVATSIANLWLKLRPLPPAIKLLGNVKFPGNILVPIEQLSKEKAIRSQEEPFTVFVNYAGYIWELGPQVYGNYPATRVQ